MTLQARITTLAGETTIAPITLKVCYEWEQWTGKTISDMAHPTYHDLAVLCWRAALNAKLIHKRTSLGDFASDVISWDILNINHDGFTELEQWLKEQ